MDNYSKSWGMQNIRNYWTSIFYTVRTAKSILCEKEGRTYCGTCDTISIFKKKFSTTLWNPEKAGHYPSKGLGYSPLICGCLQWALRFSQVICHSSYFTPCCLRLGCHTTGAHGSGHKSHHNAIIQCSFSEGIKPLRDDCYWILLPWGSGGHDSSHSQKRLHWGLGQGCFYFFSGGRS